MNQKSPTCLSELERPAPDPSDEYVNVCPDAAAKGALQASIKSAGNDAPEPERFAACAGVAVATKPNAIAAAATCRPLFLLKFGRPYQQQEYRAAGYI